MRKLPCCLLKPVDLLKVVSLAVPDADKELQWLGWIEEFVYLEHGAHYAIGILAIIMFASVRYHIPEWFTGLSGVAFILVSLWSSHRYKLENAPALE